VQKSLDNLKTAKANLASAAANLKKTKVNLDYAIIKAPIDGIVISKSVEAGQTVAATFQTPILFIIANDLTKMEIEASIDEADIGFIKVGQPVQFSVDAYFEDTFVGKVQQIRLQPKVISNVVTYTVIIDANNDNLKLMPGMTANTEVISDQRKDVLKVPIAALNFIPPSEYRTPWKTFLEDTPLAIKTNITDWEVGVLWTVDNKQLVPKKVKTGLTDGSFTEIKGPFQENDLVVIGINSGKEKSNETTNLFFPSRPGAKETEKN